MKKNKKKNKKSIKTKSLKQKKKLQKVVNRLTKAAGIGNEAIKNQEASSGNSVKSVEFFVFCTTAAFIMRTKKSNKKG